MRKSCERRVKWRMHATRTDGRFLCRRLCVWSVLRSIWVGYGQCVYWTTGTRNVVVQTHKTHTSAASETSQSVAFAGQAESRIMHSRGHTFGRPN
jgi:hypothetical protein